MLRELERHERVARRLEGDALPPTPARIAWNRVGAKVALPGDQVHEGLGERVVDAVRAEEAGRVVCGALGNEVLVLGRLHVFAKVHLAQVEHLLVELEHVLAAGEGVVVAAGGRGHFPGQQARGDRHDRVEVARAELLVEGRVREHAAVARARVVGKRQPLHDVRRGRLEAVLAGRVLGEPRRVAARDVAAARHVAHDQHVLRLRNDRLEVPSVVSLDGLDLRVGRELHVRRAEQGRSGVTP